MNAMIKEDDKPSAIRLLYKNWYKIAASILLFVLLGTFSIVYFGTNILNKETFLTYTSVNDTLGITLADGSRILMNNHSELKIPKSFNKSNRSVQLTGEAFFNITKDARHPFKVLANKTITEVLGTSFNINCRTQEVNVTLVTGKVAFYKEDNPDQRLYLVPGQHGILNNLTGALVKDSISNLNNICWKTRRLQFNLTPMNELCRELSAYYQKKIVFTGDLQHIGKFSGIIDNISLNEAAKIIEITMGIKVVQTNDSIVFAMEKKKIILPDKSNFSN